MVYLRSEGFRLTVSQYIPVITRIIYILPYFHDVKGSPGSVLTALLLIVPEGVKISDHSPLYKRHRGEGMSQTLIFPEKILKI